MDDTADRCVICARHLLEHETGRYACALCEQAGGRMIRDMPGLYRRTEALLLPSSRGVGAGPVSGSKGAPLPGGEVLNLRAAGGLVNIFAGWEQAVRDELGWDPAPGRGTYEQTLAAVCGFLADNGPWMYASFPAVDDYHGELRQWHGRVTGMVTGERPERRVTLACTDCGGPLSVTLSTPGKRCPCGAQYGFAELRALRPIAERRAA
ncbi:hypothetical protein [Streptomyces sp. DH37]|uniref:hypothetical protein n=1 Tax=Streptomyces sp. DH37 TaxID=3040122 RepID=UPI0024435650|nr:hypothetical protein [Streptomyces sp. DH37]MDG9701700.1 hypothetical protein [Streptomyces sp. DH37]